MKQLLAGSTLALALLVACDGSSSGDDPEDEGDPLCALGGLEDRVEFDDPGYDAVYHATIRLEDGARQVGEDMFAACDAIGVELGELGPLSCDEVGAVLEERLALFEGVTMTLDFPEPDCAVSPETRAACDEDCDGESGCRAACLTDAALAVTCDAPAVAVSFDGVDEEIGAPVVLGDALVAHYGAIVAASARATALLSESTELREELESPPIGDDEAGTDLSFCVTRAGEAGMITAEVLMAVLVDHFELVIAITELGD